MAKRKKARKAGPTVVSRRQPTPAELVQQGLELASRYPDEAVAILREEATYLLDDGHYEESLRLLDEAASAARAAGDRETELEIGGDRLCALEETGRDAEARREAQRIRDARPRSTGTWELLAEFLEARREFEESATWFTAGISHFLGSSELDEKAVEAARDLPGGTALTSLITGRHRVRRRLGATHDELDDLAHQVHQNSPLSLITGKPEDLDVLHDPGRQDLLDPDRERTQDEERAYQRLLEEENARLAGAVAPRRAAAEGPRASTVLYWPPEQFAALCARHPAVAEAYHDTDAERSREVEKTLRERSDQGAVRMGVTLGNADHFDRWLARECGDPLIGDDRARYGADLAAQGLAQPWPPGRNLPCWCGSARKYKKCHGAPGAV